MLGGMWKALRARPAPPSRPLLVLALPVLLAVPAMGLSGCTDDPNGRSGSPSDSATAAAPSLRERAAPLQVRYRKIAGEIPKRQRAGTLRAVSRPVRAWVDEGFVAGPWPRSTFGQAFAPFGHGIADRARRDADLLTLRAMGGSLVEVVPQNRAIAVSVTSVGGNTVGATARVHLRVLGVEEGGRRAGVTVRGDLYLTRVPEQGWQIFGYRLDRWVDQGAMTRSDSGSDSGSDAKGGA
jgi:hypothetical protein